MHDHCVHVLLYCFTCDVAYCSRCSREWGQYYKWILSSPYTTYTTSPNSLTISSTTHTQGHHAG